MADGTDGSAHRRTPPRRRRTLRIVLAVVGVLALIAGLTTLWAYRHLNGNLTKVDYDEVYVEPRPTDEATEGPQKPVDILVMGSDSREGDNDIDGLTGLGDRSDTTILLHLSGDRTRAYGVSIPRDTLVTRPDCKDPDTGEIIAGGTDQSWNAAFALGGPGCTISQFEQITGIRIDHSVVVDFSGFKDMVDAVGGVTVCIPEDIDDREHGIYLEAGTREIYGNEALSYVRVRQGNTTDGEKAIDGSDPGRIKRQQAFAASMVNKVVSAGTLANPAKLYRFLDAATKSLELGDIDSLWQLATIGAQFRDIGLDQIQFVTVPWEYTEDFLKVRMLPEADDLWARLRADKPLTDEQTSDAISADEEPGSGSSPTGTATPSTGAGSSDEDTEAREAAGLCT